MFQLKQNLLNDGIIIYNNLISLFIQELDIDKEIYKQKKKD